MGKFAPRSRFCTSQAQGYANPGKRVCSPKGEGLKIARGVCKPARLVSLDAQVPRACQPQHQEYAAWGYSLTTTVVDPGERVCSYNLQ
ncbi:hypothetical protein D5086_017765 [Populus alba]|uniref:Uncharacterized protein n=1 Tax=Populus alba TaxID=43335 RepID=A0ACC4BN10_POPAL